MKYFVLLASCLFSMNIYASQTYGPQHHMGVDALYNMNEKCKSLIDDADKK